MLGGESLDHFGGIMLQEVFVQRVSDLQPADKRKRRYLLTAIRSLSKLALLAQRPSTLVLMMI